MLSSERLSMDAIMAENNSGTTILIGTRKGAFVLTGDQSRQNWTVSKPMNLGHIIFHFASNGRVWILGAKTGHLGPTVYRSLDQGQTWLESSKPPAFPAAAEGEKGRAVEQVFWITPGHSSEPGVWYAGTSPPGLFRSEDDGDTWHGVAGFNENPSLPTWLAAGGATPGGHLLHSIVIDPTDKSKMLIAISVGGVFESADGGNSWAPLNRGCAADWLPDPSTDFGHDPHCVVTHPAKPDLLYQQNHCGIYRLERPSSEWVRIGDNMPKDVGDIGFPIVLHPRDPQTAWVFPMDGTTVWPRTSPGGRPAVYVTKDGGQSWSRLDSGLPQQDAYFTVKRQAMTADSKDPAGLYFGTSQGEVWGSIDEGQTWKCLVRYLPEIYSLEIA